MPCRQDTEFANRMMVILLQPCEEVPTHFSQALASGWNAQFRPTTNRLLGTDTHVMPRLHHRRQKCCYGSIVLFFLSGICIITLSLAERQEGRCRINRINKICKYLNLFLIFFTVYMIFNKNYYYLSFRYIALDVPDNIKFLPVFFHCIACDCILSMLFIVIRKVLVLCIITIGFLQTFLFLLFLQLQSCFLSQVFPFTFSLVFLCLVLNAISSLVCGQALDLNFLIHIHRNATLFITSHL